MKIIENICKVLKNVFECELNKERTGVIQFRKVLGYFLKIVNIEQAV